MEQKEKQWNLAWAALGIVGMVMFCVIAWNPYIQYDESYTLSLIQHSPAQIIRITGQDVHPPFYYLFVWLITLPFGGRIWAVRACNLLPLLGMLILGKTLVSRLWGEKTGLWFGALSIFLPANMSYLLPEMRMYGLVSWLVAVVLVSGRVLIGERFDVLSEKKAWFLFWGAGILAAYTQYFALIAVALCYLWLGAALFRRQKKKLRTWFLCVGVSAVLYLPWLFVLLGQFGAVREDYWIPPITMRNLLSYLLFPLYSSMTVLAGLLLGGVAGLVLVAEIYGRLRDRAKAGGHRQRDNSERGQSKKEQAAPDWAAVENGMAVYLGVIGTGVLVSIAVTPVFSVRYVKCLLGILVLCLAVLFAEVRGKKQGILWGAFLVFAVANLITINGKNADNRKTYDGMMAYAAEHFDENTVLVYEKDGHYMGIFSYWFDQYPNVLPDEYWKDEYEAFAPQLMTRTAYETEYGSLRKQGIWTVDIGNFWWWETWDGESWRKEEHSEPFVFYDQTDQLQCDLAHFFAP